MRKPLPARVKKYFWGDDLGDLNWRDHKRYIIQTLLDKGDEESVSWLFDQVDSLEIQRLVPSLKLSPKSKNFWQIYLS